MMRINYDTATVNISVVNEQRNISFQNDISLKTMRVGVLSWEKLKNRETHGRIVSLDHMWTSFVIIAWTSKKASKSKKFCLKLAMVLIWNIQSPHEDNLSSCERYKIILTSKALGTRDAHHFLIAEQELSICDSCRFDMRSRLITKMSTPEWHICISYCPQ